MGKEMGDERRGIGIEGSVFRKGRDSVGRDCASSARVSSRVKWDHAEGGGKDTYESSKTISGASTTETLAACRECPFRPDGSLAHVVGRSWIGIIIKWSVVILLEPHWGCTSGASMSNHVDLGNRHSEPEDDGYAATSSKAQHSERPERRHNIWYRRTAAAMSTKTIRPRRQCDVDHSFPNALDIERRRHPVL